MMVLLPTTLSVPICPVAHRRAPSNTWFRAELLDSWSAHATSIAIETRLAVIDFEIAAIRSSVVLVVFFEIAGVY